VTEAEAIALAVARRDGLGAGGREPARAERVIVAWPLELPPERRVDRVAWVVHLVGDEGTTDLEIDDESGRVLRVAHSR